MYQELQLYKTISTIIKDKLKMEDNNLVIIRGGMEIIIQTKQPTEVIHTYNTVDLYV
jgi:hypothetical protein